jgi:hypothetical protein
MAALYMAALVGECGGFMENNLSGGLVAALAESDCADNGRLTPAVNKQRIYSHFMYLSFTNLAQNPFQFGAVFIRNDDFAFSTHAVFQMHRCAQQLMKLFGYAVYLGIPVCAVGSYGAARTLFFVFHQCFYLIECIIHIACFGTGTDGFLNFVEFFFSFIIFFTNCLK